MCSHISRKTEVAKYAKGPEYSRSLQKVLWQSHTMRCVSRAIVTGTPSLCNTWPRNGYRLIHVQQKITGNSEKLVKVPRIPSSPKVIYTGNSLEFGEACEDRQWNRCTSTLQRTETDGRKGSTQCETRMIRDTCTIRSG